MAIPKRPEKEVRLRFRYESERFKFNLKEMVQIVVAVRILKIQAVNIAGSREYPCGISSISMYD
jgi:hypothetical protein